MLQIKYKTLIGVVMKSATARRPPLHSPVGGRPSTSTTTWAKPTYIARQQKRPSTSRTTIAYILRAKRMVFQFGFSVQRQMRCFACGIYRHAYFMGWHLFAGAIFDINLLIFITCPITAAAATNKINDVANEVMSEVVSERINPIRVR